MGVALEKLLHTCAWSLPSRTVRGIRACLTPCSVGHGTFVTLCLGGPGACLALPSGGHVLGGTRMRLFEAHVHCRCSPWPGMHVQGSLVHLSSAPPLCVQQAVSPIIACLSPCCYHPLRSTSPAQAIMPRPQPTGCLPQLHFPQPLLISPILALNPTPLYCSQQAASPISSSGEEGSSGWGAYVLQARLEVVEHDRWAGYCSAM